MKGECEHHMSESPCSEGEYISSTFSRQTGLSEDVSAEYCMREDYSNHCVRTGETFLRIRRRAQSQGVLRGVHQCEQRQRDGY